jgi:hypothetical protein
LPARSGRGEIQLNGELGPNKSKEIQGNPSKNPWISLDSFVRFGAFQWVTANPNKKFWPTPTRVRGCGPDISLGSRRSVSPLRWTAQCAGLVRQLERYLTRISVLENLLRFLIPRKLSPLCSLSRPLREPRRSLESEEGFPPRSRLESRLGFAEWNKERPPWNERFSWRGLGVLPDSPTSSYH